MLLFKGSVQKVLGMCAASILSYANVVEAVP